MALMVSKVPEAQIRLLQMVSKLQLNSVLLLKKKNKLLINNLIRNNNSNQYLIISNRKCQVPLVLSRLVVNPLTTATSSIKIFP